MPKGPLGGPRPLAEEDCNLMIGFPVQVPREGLALENEDNPVYEIEKSLSRRFGIHVSAFNHEAVRLQGMDPPLNFFIYFPIREENNPLTSSGVSDYTDYIEEVVEDVTGGPFAANVSIWAGDEKSGKEIA